jgi:DNA (cytosine-5)-methyltransferase 1
MRAGHLFNGIGGFQLAAAWMGWANVWHVEIDEWCNRVVKKHFPNSIRYGDIKEFNGKEWNGRIDLISGGDPCQPHSEAGQKKGKDDDRYLWPQYLRVVDEIRPRWIVNENVAGTINNGVLDQKISDLEAIGYSWWPPLSIPASAFGHDHQRERIWLIAYANCNGFSPTKVFGRTNEKIELQPNEALLTHEALRAYDRRAESGNHGIIDGIPVTLDERRLKGLGNAIVPQVAYQIFKAIEQYEQTGSKE